MWLQTGPAILNINERINCHNDSAAAKQDLRKLPAPDQWTPVTFLRSVVRSSDQFFLWV
jgi:hypothetical protein